MHLFKKLLFLVVLACLRPEFLRGAEDDVVTPLPGTAEDVVMADGGRLLVFKIAKQASLTIYDVETHALQTLELPSAEFNYSAGGDRALVFFQETHEVRSYDLRTLMQVGAKEFAEPVQFQQIAMGYAHNGHAYIRMSREYEQSSMPIGYMFDVAALKVIPPKQNIYGTRSYSIQEVVHNRADAEMTRWSEWARGHDGNSPFVSARVDDGYYIFGVLNNATGYMAMGDDGRIYTGLGNILVRDGTSPPETTGTISVVSQVSGNSLIPGLGGEYFLGLAIDGGLKVYRSGDGKVLGSIEPFPAWSQSHLTANNPNLTPHADLPPGVFEMTINERILLDKRIFFMPVTGHLVFLPFGNDRVVYRKFDLRSVLEKTGEEYLLFLAKPNRQAKAGEEWKYRVLVVSKHEPVQFKLAKAPEGMSLSADGQLSWRVPSGIQGSADVVISVTDPKMNAAEQTFRVDFK